VEQKAATIKAQLVFGLVDDVDGSKLCRADRGRPRAL